MLNYKAWDKLEKKMRKVETISLLTKSIECSLEANDNPIKYSNVMCVVLNAGEYILLKYTGLRDSNGVEIFFDDILTNGKINRLVIWRKDDSQIQLAVDDDNYETRIKLTQALIDIFQLTICGNKQENPELLK